MFCFVWELALEKGCDLVDCCDALCLIAPFLLPFHSPCPLPVAGETYNSSQTLEGLSDAEPGGYGLTRLFQHRRTPACLALQRLLCLSCHSLLPFPPGLQMSCCWSATSREVGMANRVACWLTSYAYMLTAHPSTCHPSSLPTLPITSLSQHALPSLQLRQRPRKRGHRRPST